MTATMQQAPIRNANAMGVSVYSHSGEFAPATTDLRLVGRGFDLEFTRRYRSALADVRGDLGRGWSSSIAKWIEPDGRDLIFHDGSGDTYRFSTEADGTHGSPTGFYGSLEDSKKGLVIRQRHGRTLRFDAAERGGRITRVEDRNLNTITFAYSAGKIVIRDTLDRTITVSLKKDLVQELIDHAGRSWRYAYDDEGRLVETIQPATADFPEGTSIRYAYDPGHRLISVTDAKGQRYLVNTYDDSDRVVAQEHGNGVFTMGYAAPGRGGGPGMYRTSCRRKNGSTVVFEHNELGNVVSRSLQAGVSSLVTTSVYNKNAELIRRIFPAGNTTEWAYSEDDRDPLNQGNLLRVVQTPQPGVESDQTSIVTSYEHDPRFQVTTAITDPRGNTTSHRCDERGNRIATAYAPVTIQPVSIDSPRPAPIKRAQQTAYGYNSRGQLLQQVHVDGSVTEYHYYPVDDPTGTRGTNTAIADPDRLCGYLARVTSDASGLRVTNEYAYDPFGNLARALDGKGNAVRVRYNAMGRVERVVGREPFRSTIDYRYDANYNEIESAQTFERGTADDAPSATFTTTTVREHKEYDVLDRLTVRTIAGGDRSVTERFIRGADGRIVRQLQPSGDATGYAYDERGLLIEKMFGVGTKAGFSERYTYTPNGALSTRTDGNGQTTTHRYDGFQRHRGFTDPSGATKTQWFDASGNVVRVAIDGPLEPGRRRPAGGRDKTVPLMEATYHIDEWDRVQRADQAWRDSAGRPLGESTWDGEEGVVSAVVEYGEDGRPGKVWAESSSVLGLDYDGLGRVVRFEDGTGDAISLEYDENGNPTKVTYDGPDTDRTPFARVLRQGHDEMDRLTWQQENDNAQERFRYNALGAVTGYVGTTGLEVQVFHDPLGRRVGHSFVVADPTTRSEAQRIARRFEYDDDYRLTGYLDAAGNRTTYRYDALGRQIGVDYADGTSAQVEYDANGNAVRVVDPNGTEIVNRYDSANRLVERQSRPPNAVAATVETFTYDGVGRMIGATAPGGDIGRSFDSLSRQITEEGGGRTVLGTYDAAGNLTSLEYPGGEAVHRAYDLRGRVTAVTNKAGERVASFSYRSGDRLARMSLGGVIDANCAYDSQGRLGSIEYRRAADQALVEGFRYQHDASGRIVHEIQLSAGATYGERYVYDDANRAARAQYGVEDVLDPRSAFERETSYEHFPEGPWMRRVDTDGQGHVVDDSVGVVDQRNRYRRFGDTSFVDDANGNCVRKGTANPGFCLYTYDRDNRIVKVECFDVQVRATQTIEYAYDAGGRQVRKVVTDQNGAATVYESVWAGDLLLEEYEDGVLVRAYLYGIGSTPARLSVARNGRSEFIYVYNGRGLASGLVHSDDPNAFAEKYGYELTGASFVTELNGVPVGLPSRTSTASGLLNSLVGSSMRDWQDGMASSPGGRQVDAGLGAILNSLGALTGQTHKSTGTLFGEQLKGFLGMLGRPGGGGEGPTLPARGGSGAPETPGKPDWSLVGMHDGKLDDDDDPPESSGSSGAPLAEPTAPPLVAAPARSLTPTSTSGGATSGIGGSGTSTPPAYDPSHNAGNDFLMAHLVPAGIAANAITAIVQHSVSIGGTFMTDPDSGASSGPITMPSPAEMEARLNKLKHPLNPNGGIGGGVQIDASSPPPQKHAVGPIALYDPDSVTFAGTKTGTGGPKPSIAPIDYVPGHEPVTSGSRSGSGGGRDPDPAGSWS